jgi:S-adenosylmethionine decarboxylase
VLRLLDIRCHWYAGWPTDIVLGPEKLLEVWFAPSPLRLPASAAPYGLKAVPADTWKEMLDLVNCKVLSVIEHDHVDAYLLSESSMFVFPHKLVLKTCGTTTLLCGLPRMLEIAGKIAGFPQGESGIVDTIPAAATPYRVFYSRKNFQFPHKQHGPHRSWRDEVRFLDRLFKTGSAYMIGKMNGEHWYLYITSPDMSVSPAMSPGSEEDAQGTETKYLEMSEKTARIVANGTAMDEDQDETLEVLMTDLDEVNARQFYLDDASAVAEGRHFQNVRKAQKMEMQHLEAIPENGGSAGSVSSDDFDVFENTSSDHSGFNSDDDGYAFPEELTTEGHALGNVVSETCGLSDVYPTSKYPDAKIDAYLFTPCGFSANGVVPAPLPAADSSESANGNGINGCTEPYGTHYFTVHVTPEPQCSYASFETNVPAKQSGRETSDIVEQVVKIFRPGRFSVTLFEAKPDESASDSGIGFGQEAAKIARGTKDNRMERIPGYRRVDRIVHDLDGYDLVFRYYERCDWKGGAPRLGEAGC